MQKSEKDFERRSSIRNAKEREREREKQDGRGQVNIRRRGNTKKDEGKWEMRGEKERQSIFKGRQREGGEAADER